MIVLDVNILVSAFHEGAGDHAEMKAWLEHTVTRESVGVSDAVLIGSLRVLTHPRVFDPPAPLEEALRVLDDFVAQPNVEILETLEGQWVRVGDLCRAANARGNLVADAGHVAHAMTHGAVFVSNDHDYARFPGLDWRTPEQPQNGRS